MKKFIKYSIIFFNIFLLFSIFLFSKKYYIIYSNKIDKNNIKINYNNRISLNKEYKVNISYNDSLKNTMCSLDNKTWKNISECTYDLKQGDYIVYLKNDFDLVKINTKVVEKHEGTFSSSLDNIDIYYLALNGSKKINFTFNYPDSFDKTINWTIEDENIISLNDTTITGKSVGTTKIHALLNDGNEKVYTIMVTDLIVPPTINENKSSLPCNYYNEEQSELLDKILESRVKEAGIGTRGGVVASSRFLTLELPYYISYFAENGRIENHNSRPYIDGEGRYYHKGLYLSKTKFDSLISNSSTSSGPAIWGCPLYSSPMGQNGRNGLDCSGFVTWAMYNGGFDVKDVGAGNFPELDDDLYDMGERHELTKDYIDGNTYKVGDYIAKNGHAGLIIGIDDNNIYTAESLGAGAKARTYGRYYDITNAYILKFVIEMGNIYPNGEGIYDNMW